ncbi:MAG: allantoinase AllB [Burkholderiaceae bacterium]|nr:allantoinase AllB [Microbacteriaceae bacterium]
MTDHLDLLLTGRTLIAGEIRPAAIGVRDGVIVSITPAPTTTAAQAADVAADRHLVLAPDEVLLPGLVDSHVHVNEPGRTEWEGFASATRAAAAGGVTTIVDMPLNSIPATVDPTALDLKRGIATEKAVVDVGFWGGAVPDRLGALGELHSRGVFGFKCFLAPSGVDEFPHLDTAQLNRALDEVASLDALLIVHAEDPGVLERSANGGGIRYSEFVASRPAEAELVAIDHLIDGVRRSGARAHILHLSSAAALPRLAAARAEGLGITVETCPHYLTITDDAIADGATAFKCCPPIRDAGNRDLLWQGLVDGVIDIVVSDHSPSTRELKLGHGGDFRLAWGGIAGLQLGLAAVWTEAARRDIRLETVLHWMSTGPADLLGLGAKGRIEVGADADLVVFAPGASFTVDVTALEHRNPVSAYDGRRLTGTVRETLLRGVPVDISAGAVPHGRLLERPLPLPVMRRPERR